MIVVSILVALLPGATARAQEQQRELEDVVLRGRVLRADGSPVANTSLRVDAVKDNAFGFFAFFATFGLSTLTCFAPESEACVLPNTKRFSSATDANGNYSFTFPKAKYKGEQTNTDYYLSIGIPSGAGGVDAIIGSYELELLDPVHNAPDLVLWDPKVEVKPAARAYTVTYEPRPASSSSIDLRIGEVPAPFSTVNGAIPARDLQDSTLMIQPRASKDVSSAGTIYHQRFTAASTPLRGALVPLSRGAACSAVRGDGSTSDVCGVTDGDLVTPGLPATARCSEATPDVPCQAPITEVRIDLGAVKEVGEIRANCTCARSGSADGSSWTPFPESGERGTPIGIRHVRVQGTSLSLAEVSVWAPWGSAAATPLPTSADGFAPTPLVPTPSTGGSDSDDGGFPLLVGLVALAALVVAANLMINRIRSLEAR